MPQIKSFQIDTVELGQDPDLQSNVDHTNIANVGTNTHVDIDTHIADSAIHLTGSPPTLAATNVSYDDTNTNLQGTGAPITEVQAAIEKLDLKRRFKNTTHTGVVSGGLITNPTGTTISISDGDGIIVDPVLNPGIATAIEIVWTGLTGITLTQEVGGFGATYIFIDNTGNVSQFLTLPSHQFFIDNIYLGTVFYEASTITLVFNEPDVADSTAVNFDNYVSFQSVNNVHGVTPIAIGAGDPNSVLEFFITDGDYFGLGANWHIDPYNPNIIQIAANGTDTTGAIPWGAGAVFDYILGDGTIFGSALTILDETVYDDGTSVAGTVPNGDGLIQFIIKLPGGKTYVQPFTQTYRDWKAANSSLSNAFSNFVKADEIKEGIVVGAYIGQQDTADWERGDRSSIVGGNAAVGGAAAASTYYIDLSTVGAVMTDTVLPAGWTTTYNGVGNFTVTHNLGDSQLGFSLSVLYNGGGRVLNPTTVTTNAITFQIVDMTDTAVEGNTIGKLLF